MSDQALLGVGALIFLITVWATLAFGYWQFGNWYDRDAALGVLRRARSGDADQPAPEAVAEARKTLQEAPRPLAASGTVE